ncbi:Plant calmodulin-binding protein-like protein [Hirschfeldia incana]|nr:Plant calmodulin-binding protein-like protein [Hirschfeldia incana]
MAEENISQVKEMMIPDEHCCFDDDAKPTEKFQETSVLETMPPLMDEEIQGDDDVLPPPPPPPAAVSNGNVNPRRYSTGTLDKRGQPAGKAQAQTRYRGNQTSSTHDLCKHGKRREEDLVVKPWKLVKKKDVEGGGDLVKGETLSAVRKSFGNVSKPDKSLQFAKRSETKSSVTPSDSPAGGVRMVKKTNLDVKKVSRINESKSSKEELVKTLKNKEKKTETDELIRCDDALEKKSPRISENKSSKEDLVKSLKKKEIDETVRFDDVSEKTLYVVESSIEEKKTNKKIIKSVKSEIQQSSDVVESSIEEKKMMKKKKVITSVKSEIQQSSVKKILRQRTPTLIPSLSPSSEVVKESRVTKSDPRPIKQTTSRSKTGLSEKKVSGSASATLVTNSKTESKVRPKRIGIKVTPPPSSGPPTRPVSFRKGKVLDPKQEDFTPTSIKFKKRVVQEPKLRSDGNKKKKNLKDVGKVSYNRGEGKREKVVLRHRKVEAKKKLQTLFNNVIEETVNKLEEVRKSKVKALVGAFETVISLQDNDITSHKKKAQSKTASSQVVEG